MMLWKDKQKQLRHLKRLKANYESQIDSFSVAVGQLKADIAELEGML